MKLSLQIADSVSGDHLAPAHRRKAARRYLALFQNLFENSLSELAADPVVRAYSWAIVAGHATVLLFFLDTGVLALLSNRVEPLCWPYFADCWKYRLHSTNEIVGVLTGYWTLIALAAVSLIRKHIRAFWCSALAMNVLLLTIVSLDYRFRANEFYMLFWLNLVFLAWPSKRWSIPLTIVSFYFWAGTLKLNTEWLSGAVLYGELWWIPQRLAWVACWYVVFLEMVMIWGLLVRSRLAMSLVLAQLALFHIESLSQIHWFYPVLMATILSWFVIESALGTFADRPSLKRLIRRRAPGAAYGIMVVFAAFQCAPLMFRGDSVLTGQGRIFALHMFEARQVCEVQAVVHYRNQSSTTVDLELYSLPPRMICDPIVYYGRIQNICRTRGVNDVADADFLMRIRRTTDSQFHTVVDERAFCTGQHKYSIFGNNVWLK